MTSLTPNDDTAAAAQRDIPTEQRVYTVTFSSATAKTATLPYDVKVASIENQTNQTLIFNVSYQSDPGNLVTNDTDSRVERVTAGSVRPVAQNKEFNIIYFKAGVAATGTVYIRLGSGQANGLATPATREVGA